MVAVAIHLPLLMMQLPLKSYDTNFHIFFASHYVHHWFDPWNVKWFAGFSQTTYPPLSQQWVAVASLLLGLNAGYMAVQFAAILLLAIGAYRFSLLWVDPRAASYAALAAVLVGSESFLVYNAGQLATTFAAPIYLNALPYLFEWLRYGRGRAFIKAIVLFAAAAAAHHATLIFGSMLFALPVMALAWMERDENGERVNGGAFIARAIAIGVISAAVVAVVLLPFWIGLYRYPVTQTPIPHPSRANYILSPEQGINFFIVPYGAMILALPFIIIKGASVPRLRPLMLGFWLCFLFGLGGTTPVGVWLLRRAFDVLTFERFSYWATLLALPILGALIADLIGRFRLRAAIPIGVLGAATCALAVSWSFYRPNDAQDFKVEPIAQFLNRDGHDAYRYITLGIGNKLSRLAVLTDATSVDGESNSSRMLPELTQFGGGALTDAKYFPPGGLESLRTMLRHADRYGVRWVFVRDPYYEPILVFAGWRHVDNLEDNTVTVWAKDGVAPAKPMNVSQKPPAWQGLMWGTLPFGSSILALLLAFVPDRRRRSEYDEDEDEAVTPISQPNPTPGRMVS